MREFFATNPNTRNSMIRRAFISILSAIAIAGSANAETFQDSACSIATVLENPTWRGPIPQGWSNPIKVNLDSRRIPSDPIYSCRFAYVLPIDILAQPGDVKVGTINMSFSDNDGTGMRGKGEIHVHALPPGIYKIVPVTADVNPEAFEIEIASPDGKRNDRWGHIM